MNKNYKSCEKGHFYASTFESCPHCKNQFDLPSNNSSSESNEHDTDKTKIIGQSVNTTENVSGIDKTIGNKTQRVSGQHSFPTNDDDKTRVVSNPGKNPQSQSPSASRKLVGWLVSYTLSDLGVDFKLYEGQNVIGRDHNCNVRITEDSSISSKHATLLFRGNHFYLRDEMSTNPSFINQEEVMPGNTIKLNDGDKIRVGDTELCLRYALIKTE